MKLGKILTTLAMVACLPLSISAAHAQQGANQPAIATNGLLPAQGGVVTGVNAAYPEFQWNCNSTATDYQLWINIPGGAPYTWNGTSANCSNPVTGVGKHTPPGTMVDGKKYYWWIGTQNQYNNAGKYTWSARYDYTYLLNAAPPAAPSAYYYPIGSWAATTQTQFQWENASTSSWYRLTIYDQNSGIEVARKWYTAAQANCAVSPNTIATCTIPNYAAHVGTSYYKDYCWTIIPWNSQGSGPEGAWNAQCFYNDSQ